MQPPRVCQKLEINGLGDPKIIVRIAVRRGWIRLGPVTSSAQPPTRPQQYAHRVFASIQEKYHFYNTRRKMRKLGLDPDAEPSTTTTHEAVKESPVS